jgi:hypothetical protein
MGHGIQSDREPFDGVKVEVLWFPPTPHAMHASSWRASSPYALHPAHPSIVRPFDTPRQNRKRVPNITSRMEPNATVCASRV